MMTKKRKDESSLRRSKRLKREDETEFEVLDCKETSSGLQYKVRWAEDQSSSWVPASHLSCRELLEDFKVDKMKNLIKKRKITPSSLGSSGDIQTIFTALLGRSHLAWELPQRKISQATIQPRPLPTRLSGFLGTIEKRLEEVTELGMYGRATLLFVEMAETYDDVFPPGVSLKVCSPLDGKAIIDYALMIVYLVDNNTSHTMPAMIIEIKREVNVMMSRVAVSKVVQVLLESTYTMQEKAQRKILACLTDLSTFHLLKLEKDASETLEVTECSSFIAEGKMYSRVFHSLIAAIKHFYEEEMLNK